MIKTFAHDIDLVNNKLINLRIHPLTTHERMIFGGSLGAGNIGQLVYDTTEQQLYFWTGSQWKCDLSDYQESDPTVANYIKAITQLQIQSWDLASKHRVTSIEVQGAEDKDVVLTRSDGSTIRAGFKDSFRHVQSEAQSIWVINHNLNKRPSIFVQDTAGEDIEGDYEYPTLNQVRLQFSVPVSGEAILN